MKKLTVLLGVFLLSAAAAAAAETMPPKSHPDSKDWPDLFQADLSDALFPKGVWSFADGVLTATRDENIWTKKQYRNCIIDLEFKTAPGTNSGVFVYGSDLKDFIPNSIEVQILDDFSEEAAKYPKSWLCAGIFGRLAPTKSLVKKPGEWNRMTVACLGPKIYVILNGEQVTEFDMRKWTSVAKNPDGSDVPPWLSKPAAKLPLHGHVGLQGKHAGAPIYFRNMKIKALD